MDDVFRTEIGGQPDRLVAAVAALHRQRPALERLPALAGPGTPIVLTGMGSSYDACLAAASVLGSAGLLAVTVNAAELVHFRLPALRPETLVVAVSQSGRSAELVRLVRSLGPGGLRPRLVSITNGLDNPVAAAADVALDTAAGEENGPSTATFLATFAALAPVLRIMTGARTDAALAALTADAAVAGDRIRDLLAGGTALAAELAGWLAGRSSLLLVGRGTARAAAEVGALILKEAAGFPAECLDTAEFRHGPLELAGPGLAVAVVATEPGTYELDRRLAVELARHGAAVLLLTPGPDTVDGVTVLPVGAVDRLFAAAVAAVPFQLLAWQLAVASRRPGMFTTAAKVTTRE
jgi:glutamine---fructose-6-phosphate transaminase (isomerizing)